MNDLFWQAMSYALIPALAVLGGGIFAAYRQPKAKTRSLVQHFAAGLLFAAVATELLPDIMHDRAPVATVIGFALGVGLMLLVKRLTEGGGQKGVSETDKPTSLLVTLGIDVLIDGLLVGIAFAAGAEKGFLLTLALTVEVLFLGLSASVALSKAGESRRKMIAASAALGFLLLVGAGVGAGFLAGLTGVWLDVVLSFGAAALLYLVTEELLVEAHEEPETPFLTAAFFIGFVALLVVEMLA